MYGVPADLPISAFVGHEFSAIQLGRFQIQLHCSGVGSISIDSGWRLCTLDGTTIDEELPHAERTEFRIHRIIDVPVVRTRIDPPHSFTLAFANDLELTVFDDNPHYETLSVHVGRNSWWV